MDTGDPVPGGYDAVIMREQVHERGDGAVELDTAAAALPARALDRRRRERRQSCCCPPDTACARSTSARLGAAGVPEVTVRRQPVVAVIPTGDEIRPLDSELRPGELPDTNSLMLCAQAVQAGCEARRSEVVGDDPPAIAAALREAGEGSDLVILIAGSSAGRDDYTAEVVAAGARSPCTAWRSSRATPLCWERPTARR